MKLDRLLPEVYQSQTNHSAFENLFNRFLTKNETKNVSGYIGRGNSQAIVSRQIREPTIDRQAFQLQPIINAKVGSVDHMASWKDILNELERLGVDIERLPVWGSVQKFNWVPPIDMDKLINYQDYYWYDELQPNSRPQYITIRSRCKQAEAYANFWERLVSQYGQTIEIDDILVSATSAPTFTITSITSSTVIVENDIVGQLTSNQSFNLVGTTSNDGIITVASTPTYDPITDRSTISVVETLVPEGAGGSLQLRQYNRFVFNGDYGRLFEPGFVFYVTNSTNSEINNTFFTVTALDYDDENTVATVTVNVMLTNSTVSGDVSLQDSLTQAEADRDCQCTGTIGWDQSQWDDNPEDPIWGGIPPGDHATFIASISNPGPPSGSPIFTPPDTPMWYDTDGDVLYEWDGTEWNPIVTNFSVTLAETDGGTLWDQAGTDECGIPPYSESAQQWIDQNKWLHKTDVPNFNIAKKAQIPIIEYDWDLELNEWTFTDYTWKYRKNDTIDWATSTVAPSLLELIPFTSYTQSTATIILDESYGDQTQYFKPGKLFRSFGNLGLLEVAVSYYKKSGSPGSPYQTYIELTADPGVLPGYLYPLYTAMGDSWIEYDNHWVFVGSQDTVPVNHQPINPFLEVTSAYTVVGDYQYATGPYTQENVVLVDAVVDEYTLDASLRNRALIGSDDVRVYIDGIRQYGTYNELTEVDLGIGADETHVAGIGFLSGYSPNAAGQVVRIELGEASILDIGYSQIPVRTTESDTAFAAAVIAGTEPLTVSLIKYRKVEQIKTATNQYPLFDIYNADGTSAYRANPIFAFETSPTATVHPAVGLRLVLTTSPLLDFGFEQFLIDVDNGTLFAYRDYSSQNQDFWFDTKSQTLKVWDGTTWADQFYVEDYYATPHVGDTQPDEVFRAIEGFLWYDTVNEVLKSSGGPGSPTTWNIVTDVIAQSSDNTLRTIWRPGTNDERYVPKKVDWLARSEAEYDSQRDLFITERAEELEGLGQTPTEATAQATTEWYLRQKNDLSPTGVWIGDWEIPDPLYFNNLHENRKVVTYRELITHFTTIIDAQPKVPAYVGPNTSSFHLLSMDSINYGLGGRIKEFNDGFDTFLSSIFVDTVTPRTLIEFAHDQYEGAINNLIESYRRQLISLMSNTSTDSLIDFSNFASDTIINSYEENDNGAFVYGDSTTFTDNEGSNDIGIRNWIATLPYFKLVHKTRPTRLLDSVLNIDALVHHDSHLNSYQFTDPIIETLSRNITRIPDDRGNVPDTFGRVSSVQPPNNYTQFESVYLSTITNRAGVYWYQVPSVGDRVLYRMAVVSAGTIVPPSTVPDGTLWVDTRPGLGTLRIKATDISLNVTWDPVPGLTPGDERLHNGSNPNDITTATYAAYQPVQINTVLNDIIFNVETMLFDNAPDYDIPPYDLEALPSIDANLYDTYLEEAFLDYVSQQEISSPFKNVDYVFDDAFTWNYKYSTIGLGHEILDTDVESASFTIDGNYLATFNVADLPFYIKNGGLNDGTWTTLSTLPTAVYDSIADRTTVYTQDRTVVTSSIGTIYLGTLASDVNTGAESGGDWRDLYQKVYNTPYPHLEPWKLQGYESEPEWWTAEFAVLTDADIVTWGNRRWKYDFDSQIGMWEYIRTGTIPPGYNYPSGVTSITGDPTIDRNVHGIQIADLPAYNYFSVNITNGVVSADGGLTNFSPDDVFPPFWDYLTYFGGAPAFPDTLVRSLFSSYNGEIVTPSADYAFGDAGPIEWQWRTSSQFLYDQMTIGFRMDPVRYVAHTFGKDFIIVDDLQIDDDTDNTFSHTRTNFHGEIVDDRLYQVNGTNQWYVNYTRYTGFDTNYSNFRTLWTQWYAPLTYQFSAFIDTQSLSLGHRVVPVSNFDWQVTAKSSPGVTDHWYDAFRVSVVGMPPAVVRYNNESQWIFEVNTNLPIARTINYYDVRNYPFRVDLTNNICSLYTYDVVDLDFLGGTISVDNDQSALFKTGSSFEITDSIGNNGTYTVNTSVYDSGSNTTIITIEEEFEDGVVQGIIKLDYRDLPWQTGDLVFMTSDETMASPLLYDTEYFIIRLNEREFRLAETSLDATANIPIELTTIGRQQQFVGQVHSTFKALNGAATNVDWKHYVPDTTNVLTFTTPAEIVGVQQIINIIDGYQKYQSEQGWVLTSTASALDPNATEAPTGWQMEIENFINYIFSFRKNRNRPASNVYEISVDTSTDIFTFIGHNADFMTGAKVTLNSDTGVLPDPLVKNLRYYVIRDSLTTFRLAASPQDARAGTAIDIELSSGYGTLYISAAATLRDPVAVYELNAFRTGIAFRPERGIVSNVFTGPSEDVRSSQLIFDQNGEPIPRSNARIFREDKQTQISVPATQGIHLGGLHLYTDTYEHVLIFNNYTTGDALIYDPFVGLNVTKFELEFQRQIGFTQRPNVGGYYYQTYYNQNPELKRNIESSVEELRNLYDTYTAIESDPMIVQSRKTLGYEGLKTYLNDLNINPKSQFIFWRGMIQRKGSVNAITAFINSRRFIDAKVDEFWAVKIADFGSAAEKEYPELYLTTSDARSNDLRLDFITEDDLCLPGYAMNTYDQMPCGYAYPEDGEPILIGSDGFIPILVTDESRWYNQPDQMAILKDNGETMYFTLKTVGYVQIDFFDIDSGLVGVGSPQLDGTAYVEALSNKTSSPSTYVGNLIAPYSTPADGQGIIVRDFDGFLTISTFWTWDASNDIWVNGGYWDDFTNRTTPSLRHGFKSDAVEILLNWYTPGFNVRFYNGSPAGIPFSPGNQITLPSGYIPFASSIKLFKDGRLLESGIDYSETVSTGLLSNDVFFPVALDGSEEIQVEYTTSKLVEGLHYQNVNSDVVQFLYPELVTAIAPDSGSPSFNSNFRIWGLVQDDNSQNPAKIIDVIAQTVLTPVQMWDPARGMNYYNSMHNVDLENDRDPALYTNTPLGDTQYAAIEPGVGFNRTSPSEWNIQQVGTTWLDTAVIDYFRYYDLNAVPDLETRFVGWGNLADWASITVREWVESDVTPDEYNEIAALQENDVSIDEQLRKSGRVNKRLFRKVGTDWVRFLPVIQQLDVAIDGTPNSALPTQYTFAVDSDLNFNLGGSPTLDVISIYVNGRLLKTVDYDTTVVLTVDEIKYEDHLTFVAMPPTDQEIIDEFVEAGTMLQDYEYTITDYYDQFGIQKFKYYFWVENKLTKNNNRTLSPAETGNQLVALPTPYMFFQNLKQPTRVVVDGYLYNIPLRFSQSIIRGLRGIIDADRRYILRYTRDYTLRDSLDHGKTALQLKNKHQEWKMIRQNQTGKIDRWLWDRITESMVQFKLDDPTIRVPSLNRELYDQTYGTDTQYGLGDGQAFANGTLALGCVLFDLQNPENDFTPVDIDLFFDDNTFETATDVVNTMDLIYTSFAAEHVNRIFFSVLHNAAFSQKAKYADIFKTSMIALHGIRPFQVGALFDD
jgi:hypothetical protein